MMRRVPLPPAWTKLLLDQPESGMGYQLVEVEMRDGLRINGCMVYNAETIELPEPYIGTDIRSLVLAPPEE